MSGMLTAAALAVLAAAAASSGPPAVVVVVAGHEGVTLNEARSLSSRLSQALKRAGATVALEPEAALARLGARNPEACQGPACFAEVAGLLGVSGLVTLEVGKVLDQLALVAAVVDGRDGKRLAERSNAVSPPEVDRTLAAFAAELLPTIQGLPPRSPSAGSDAPRDVALVPREAGPRPPGLDPDAERERGPGLGVYVAGGATVATGVAAGAALLWGYLGHQEMNRACAVEGGRAGCTFSTFQSLCHPTAADPLACKDVNDRYTASALLGISSAVMGAVTGYLLATAPP
jgi:hypothetical protein